MVACITPDLDEERTLLARGFRRIAGLDEVGCGCWAGPVLAAAVILPAGVELELARDSKSLSPAQRERAAADIKTKALAWAVGQASAAEIDAINIRRAAALAMERAVESLPVRPEFLLIDAFRLPAVDLPQKNIIRGDAAVVSIAAASIIAKVARDALLADLAEKHPGYGFENHKGYGTREHRDALSRLGPCPEHRLTYQPVRRSIKQAA